MIRLQMGEEWVKALKDYNRKVVRHLDKGMPLRVSVLKELKDALSGVVRGSGEWAEVLRGIRDSGDYYCVHLLHDDNEILNLPWSMAVDKISGQPLGQIRRLILAKGIPGFFEEKSVEFSRAPAPLKVLIMISSPEDIKEGKRLSYENEEFEILKAFEPLMQSGLVEVDFTGDGSLDALEQKLKANKYHILHFSGHAVFNEDEQTGYLQLEDPVNLKTLEVKAGDFAETVICTPGYCVPMVVLSSCQTAKGSSEEGLRGIYWPGWKKPESRGCFPMSRPADIIITAFTISMIV